MDLEARLFVLNELYRIFDAFINTQELACARHCDACCTRNVSLTTLEGLNLVRHLDADGDAVWVSSLARMASGNRFRPQVTTNRLAALCAEGAPLPDEPNDPGWGRCALLSQRECPAYLARPFACRCMVSQRACATDGHADMPPLIVTVSNVFMQSIEHVDVPGCTGNLVDVLSMLADDENRNRYLRGELACDRHLLLENQPIGVLMVPPEHRDRVRPLLDAINGIRVPG